ncbi:MAG: dUTP diphosphatase [Candidatus Absconditabacterales bacterium]|nr:dUTP diphosphatase [Candidatus Absconditabacterales bacterium]
MEIKFKKLSDSAIIPIQNTPSDAGYDLFSVENYILKKGERKLFKTNIACAVPEGFYARIAPRSGLAYKHGIDVLAGVIDSGYRGDVGVILINFGEDDFAVSKGDKIAQLIIEKCHYVKWSEVENLDETERNEGGFGSSGK